jgi:acetyltransferase-like isoleucine patch superfamily enzyme
MKETKNIFSRIFSRILHAVARNCPGAMTLRPFLHRLRGVKIGKDVWIGDDVYLENEHPELVELQDGCVLGIRAMVVAHTRGQGNVVIERRACVGPGAIVMCSSGRTLRIGEGAVISTGSIVTSNVLPQMLIAPPRSVPVARATVPFGVAESMEEFVAGMEPLRRAKGTPPPENGSSAERN